MGLQGIRIEINTQAAIRGIERHDEAVYTMGFIDGIESMKQRNRERREMQERKRYFITQRLFGLASLIIAALSAWLLDGDATVALVMVPLGVILITSRQMLIVNRYYWKNEEDFQRIYGQAIKEKEAKTLLKKYDYTKYVEMFGELPEA